MSDQSSTFRSLLDSTKRSQSDKQKPALQEHLADLGHSTLASAVREWPAIANDRSLFFDLVQKDYREQHNGGQSYTPEQYCNKFTSLSSDLLRSIHRLVEVERFFSGNPDLLSLVDEPDWPVVGQISDGFLIEEELGRGALSKVFLCQQLAIGKRKVVLKVTTVARHEAWVLGKLNHPNIMPIHAVGVSKTQEGLNWICMPYLGKATLQAVIEGAWGSGAPQSSETIFDTAAMELTPNEKPLSISNEGYTDRILQIALELADALRYVHQQGVLHGDLKPSNVLITPEGKPLLIDFNLSSDEASNIALLGGTLPYMAPEQLTSIKNGNDAQPGPSTIQTEVYGLSRLILHALTGQDATPQHSFTEIESVAQAIQDDRQLSIPKAIAQVAEADPTAAALLQECLVDNPDKRPRSLQQVHERLGDILQSRNAVSKTTKILTRRFVIVSGMVALLALAAWQISNLRNHPDRLMRKAEMNLEAGLPEQALSIYRHLVTKYPAEYRYAEKCADSLLDMHEYRQAAEAYIHVARQFGNPIDYAMSGYCLNLAGEHAQAIPWYKSAEELGITSVAIRGNLAASRRNQLSNHYSQQISLAVESGLNSALEMDPGNEVIRFQMLRHYCMSVNSGSPDYPTYPISILSPLPDNPSPRFLENAVSFLVIKKASKKELEVPGLAYIRLLAIANGGELGKCLSSHVLLAFMALPGFDAAISLPFPNYIAKQQVYYLNPRNYEPQRNQ